jgi:hypothetical protein
MGYVDDRTPEADAHTPWAFGRRAAPGQTYVPRPSPSTGVRLHRELRQLAELLAENTHEIWTAAQQAQGWVFGPARDDAPRAAASQRPEVGLVPYFSCESAAQ